MPTVELEVLDLNVRDTLAIDDACAEEETVISRTRAATRPSLLSPVLTASPSNGGNINGCLPYAAG